MNKLEILELLHDIFSGQAIFIDEKYNDIANDIWMRIEDEKRKIQEETEIRLLGLI